MAATIKFKIPAPAAGEDAAVRVVWYESPDGLEFTEIADELVASLDVVDDFIIWPLEAADPANYQMIKTKSAGGVESAFGAMLPPLPTSPGLQSVFGSVKEFGAATWAENDVVEVTMKGNQLNSGVVVEPVVLQTTVNVNGLFAILVDKGCNVTLQVKNASTLKPYFTKAFEVSADDLMDVKDY